MPHSEYLNAKKQTRGEVLALLSEATANLTQSENIPERNPVISKFFPLSLSNRQNGYRNL